MTSQKLSSHSPQIPNAKPSKQSLFSNNETTIENRAEQTPPPEPATSGPAPTPQSAKPTAEAGNPRLRRRSRQPGVLPWNPPPRRRSRQPGGPGGRPPGDITRRPRSSLRTGAAIVSWARRDLNPHILSDTRT